MSSGPSNAENTQVISWLDEQRRIDQQSIAALSQDIERLTSLARTQESRLLHLTEEIQTLRQEQARIGIIDDTVRSNREHLERLAERADRIEEAFENQRRLRAADHDRDRQQINDTASAVIEFQRHLDALGVPRSGVH